MMTAMKLDTVHCRLVHSLLGWRRMNLVVVASCAGLSFMHIAPCVTTGPTSVHFFRPSCILCNIFALPCMAMTTWNAPPSRDSCKPPPIPHHPPPNNGRHETTSNVPRRKAWHSERVHDAQIATNPPPPRTWRTILTVASVIPLYC
jgi:hypothetical protein